MGEIAYGSYGSVEAQAAEEEIQVWSRISDCSLLSLCAPCWASKRMNGWMVLIRAVCARSERARGMVRERERESEGERIGGIEGE